MSRDAPAGPEPSDAAAVAAAVSALHFRVGWWCLLGFVSLGLVLEALHGFKIGLYLDVSNETRRHLWTLGHAHGTLLSILNVVFAATVRSMPGWDAARRRLASRCLLGALLLLPAGFLLGGVTLHGGDPGLGVLLTPPGGLLLVAAILLTARGTRAL